MKYNFLKLIVFLLTITLLLTGCGYSNTSTDNESDDTASSDDGDEIDGYTSITSTDGEVTNPDDDVFTLCWLKSKSLNPYNNLIGENAAVSSLMYEGLFAITPDFTAEPWLCTGYTVSDLTYTFDIKSGVTFHDGSTLTANDIVYSINRARESERFASRLNCITNVSTNSELTVEVTVNKTNYTLPTLLDIPIVKRNTGGNSIPVGTGPYVYNRGSNEAEPYLSAYEGYRDNVPVQNIYLYDISETRPAIAMSQHKVDFILHTPLKRSLEVAIDHSAFHYDTTILQYVGFDTNDSILGISEIRRAISHLVNRELIVNEVMGASNATVAPLVLSPNAPGYSDVLENISEYSTQTFSSILNGMGAVDSDGDGWLELNGNTMSFTFIVCDSDDYKVEAAKKIVSAMNSVGIKVNLRALSYEKYLQALDYGNFDMYYAEVRLPANFDLSAILATYGNLNYGGCSKYNEVLENYLAAETEDQKSIAADELCHYIYENSPIVPICYNQNAVVVPRSLIQGVNPSQQNLFWNLSQWTVNFDKED